MFKKTCFWELEVVNKGRLGMFRLQEQRGRQVQLIHQQQKLTALDHELRYISALV